MLNLVTWSPYTPPSLSILHLVSGREVKPDSRFRYWYTGEDGIMLSFGEQRFLVGHMNRLLSMSKSFYKDAQERPMYPHDWHCSGSNIEIQFFPGVRYVWHEGVRMEDVKEMYFLVDYESEVFRVQAARYGLQRFNWYYTSIDITSKLILLQRCVRGYNARRRMARRLALAMALHSRLGNGCLLKHLPTELMLAAT